MVLLVVDAQNGIVDERFKVLNGFFGFFIGGISFDFGSLFVLYRCPCVF